MDAWKRIRALWPASQPLTTAALAVLTLLTLWLSWITTSGTSTAATLSWCLVVAAGVGAASLIPRFVRSTALPAGAAAVAALISVWLSAQAFDVCLTLGVSAGLPGIGVWLIGALPALLGALAAGLLLRMPAETAPGRRLGGIALGAALFMSHAWLSLPFLLVTTVLTALVVTGTIRGLRSGRTSLPAGPGTGRQLMALNTAAGVGLVAGGMVLHRVFSVSPMAMASAVTLTVLILLLLTVPILRATRRPWAVWCCSLAVLALLPLAWSDVLIWNLQYRAAATSGMSVILFQSLQLSAWAVPLLVATAAGCSVISDSRRPGDLLQFPAVLMGVALGWGLLACGLPVVWLAAGSLITIAVIPAILLWQAPAVNRRFSWLRLAGSAAAVIPALTLVLFPPDLAAPSHLLFTVRSLAAVQRGVDAAMIPETDAARLVARQETADGTVTTWKTQANRFEFRLNGQQVGEISTKTSTTPQPPAEVLNCVLPLVLHPHAGSVLLLDDFTGVAVGICEQFPLHRVVSVESRSTDLAESLIPRPKDGRIKYLTAPPEIAVRDAGIEPVDVVISSLADPARSASLSRLSTAWFQRVSDRLNTDGVFCQRLRQRSADRVTIARLLGCASAVFEKVALVQLVPGELALVASNSSTPLLDRGVLRRMERRHVRQVLGRCGWDWCQLAALTVLDSADPVGLWNHEEFPVPSGLLTGSPGLRLGWQAVRPGNQALTVYQMLAPHQRRMAEAIPFGPTHDEFRRRISAYAQQVEVLTAFPDEPWIYRKSLKSEMQRNQRQPVEEMRDGELHRTIHPLDQHRKDYLATIGGLLKQIPTGQLSAADLRRLSSFSLDYEPLISDFAHYELVRIHELAQHPSPVDEFQHRLHTVHYSQPGEHSVRNVIAALDQLTRQAEIVDSDEERFDLLNSLIQELIVRWESRTHFEPRSAVRMQRDVELSIEAVQRALVQMEQLKDVVGMEDDDFLMRRRFVAEALIRPLRDYEKQVLAHRAGSEPAPTQRQESAVQTVDDSMLRMLMDQSTTN